MQKAGEGIGLVARLFLKGAALAQGLVLSLGDGPSRHVQVLRLQPGDPVTLFDGQGGEWQAVVSEMGRKAVVVEVMSHQAVDRELPGRVTLAVGMPANDRMDALVEKATELGVHAIQPLICARSVLKLDGERALKKVAHWQSVAVAASEQSGRTRVPIVQPISGLKAWLAHPPTSSRCAKGLLSFAPEVGVHEWMARLGWGEPDGEGGDACFLSGPEGGLDADEEACAKRAGWTPIGLGPRVLRADTAPLMALSCVAGLWN